MIIHELCMRRSSDTYTIQTVHSSVASGLEGVNRFEIKSQFPPGDRGAVIHSCTGGHVLLVP